MVVSGCTKKIIIIVVVIVCVIIGVIICIVFTYLGGWQWLFICLQGCCSCLKCMKSTSKFARPKIKRKKSKHYSSSSSESDSSSSSDSEDEKRRRRKKKTMRKKKELKKLRAMHSQFSNGI
jgi:hypothetical protein